MQLVRFVSLVSLVSLVILVIVATDTPRTVRPDVSPPRQKGIRCEFLN